MLIFTFYSPPPKMGEGVCVNLIRFSSVEEQYIKRAEREEKSSL